MINLISINWQSSGCVFPGIETGRKTNELTITQFAKPKFYEGTSDFKRALLAVSADDVPYTCIYCREDFTGGGAWAAIFDGRALLLSIHIVFSCRTCFRELEDLKPRLAEKMRAKSLRRLFALLAEARGENTK